MTKPVPNLRTLKQGGFLIARVSLLVDRVFGKMLKTAGLNGINPAQTRILYTLLRKKDPLTITELSAYTSLSNSSLTTMLDRLEKKGLLRRTRPGYDRRTILIELTNEEKKIRDLYLPSARRLTHVMFRGVNATDRRTFENVLGQVLFNLDEFEKNHEE